MDPQKFAEIQMQMRHNQTDYADFLNDLDSWSTDIKKKDEKLKNQGEKDGTENNLPPVRNSLDKKKKKKKKKPKTEEAKQTDAKQPKAKKKIRSYDYRSWDKFDVDAACKEVDDKSSSSPSEYETDEEWEAERKKQQAVLLKDEGNNYFKNGKYDEAIECYTRGIDCDSSNPILPANRAMALLKQEKYGAAELDCTRTLSIDSSYIKAYHRRGTARAALKKYKEAKVDFNEVLKLEPGHKTAKAELEKIERLLNPPEILTSKNLDVSEAGIVKPVYKPPDQRSKKPLRRIEIEEIGNTEEEERRAARAAAIRQQSKTQQELTQKDNAMFEKLVSGKKDHDDVTNEADDKVVLGDHLSSPGEILSPSDIGKLNISGPGDIGKSDGTAEDTSKPEGSKKSQKLTNGSAANSVSPNTSPRIPDCPTTSFQFQTDWKTLKNHTEKFYQYFKKISPPKYPKLFGESLDADILVKIFTVLKDYYIPSKEDVFSVLSSLTKVKRFSMTTMFMSAKEKKDLQEIFQYLNNEDSQSKEELEKLSKMYL